MSIFDRFAEMIAEGSFPYPARGADSTAAPRVGDGVMSLDDDGRVRYLSPNANSALHRVGIHANAVGMRLAELGFHDDMVRKALEHRVPVVEEFEQASDVALLCRCLPILAGGEVAGGVLLVRDVTDLRKRDRLLISKDATIREIHHRVKNNLQTISSLLRLQARRLENPEAKAAVSESVRRIRTIALVHESLSREPGDDVTFIEIVRPLLRLAEESLQSPDRPVHFTLAGDGGRIPARVATPLSVVLTELMQNAVDHGFPEGSGGGKVVVDARQRRASGCASRSIDDGRGPRARLRPRRGDRARPVDRAHARDDRAQRADRDAPGDGRRPRRRRPRRARRRPRHGRRARRSRSLSDRAPPTTRRPIVLAGPGGPTLDAARHATVAYSSRDCHVRRRRPHPGRVRVARHSRPRR